MNNKYDPESPVDSHQIIQLLEDKIYEHNSAVIDQENGYLFSRVVRDKNKNIIAGIAGWTWAHACEITQLWVHEDVRKNGIGKMLLDAAEEEAKRNDAAESWLGVIASRRHIFMNVTDTTLNIH